MLILKKIHLNELSWQCNTKLKVIYESLPSNHYYFQGLCSYVATTDSSWFQTLLEPLDPAASLPSHCLKYMHKAYLISLSDRCVACRWVHRNTCVVTGLCLPFEMLFFFFSISIFSIFTLFQCPDLSFDLLFPDA